MTARPNLQRGVLAVPCLLGLVGSGLAAGIPAAARPASPAWRPYPATAVAPPARREAAMAYDAASNQVVLFGGLSASGSVLGDTWVWSGSAWHKETPADGPPPLEGASMAYDSSLKELILFGGLGSTPAPPSNATWAWNGASWYPLDSGASTLPPARSGAVLASAGGAFLLFGGTAADGSVLDDTWTFDGSEWAADSPATSPPPLTGAASTWDAARHQVVVFGGQSAIQSPSWSAETWTWSGSTWVKAATSGPSARTGGALAYDGDLAGDVLIGGTGAAGVDSDTWLFDGRRWTPMTAYNPPPARYLAAAAWDSAGHQLVLFGGAGASGTVLGDTQTLSVPASTPPATTTTRPHSHRPSHPTTSTPARLKPASRTTVPGRRSSPPSTALHRHTPTSAGAGMTASPVPATLRAASPRVKRGQTVRVMGSGFQPGALVSLSMHSQPIVLGTTHADAAGRFDARVLVPSDVALGHHHLEASGRLADGSERTLAIPVQVLAVGSGRPVWETLSMVALALLIPLVTWIVMDVRSRRRHRAAARSPGA
jgi:hypothetical protein